MDQINIFDILDKPEGLIIKSCGLDKEFKKYVYKIKKRQFQCKHCGYNPRKWIDPDFKNVKYYLIVEPDYNVKQTLCENCVHWADNYMNKEWPDYDLKLIEWNKEIRKILKKLWLEKGINRDKNYFIDYYKPYWIDNGTRFLEKKESTLTEVLERIL